MEFTEESRKPHIAIFPLSAGMGHYRPTAEFAKRLCAWHGFSVTLIISKWQWTSQQAAFTQSLASSALDIRITEIPEVSVDEDEENMKIETLISKFVLKARPHIAHVLQSLLESSSPVSAFVTDFFCTDLLDVTAKLNLPSYILFPASASCLCVMMRLPKIVSETEISFKDADFDVQVPGLPPIPARDLPTPVQDRSDSACYWFVHHGSRFKEATGILINTFAELEEEPLKALTEGKIVSTPEMPYIYPIGPLMVENTDRPEESDCLKWLDLQPPSSVVFVSFGSGSVLTGPQITDLALGLEASGHRFLWVVRGYKSESSSLETELSRLLPEGFENRTSDRGLAVLNWAPQVGVLSHPATGGFISHCGWNSTLESICHGVPMIGWPFDAEQAMNRVILVKQIKVAIDLKRESDGFVGRDEVKRAVKELMEGEEGRKAREKMKELKGKVKIALMAEGSTVNATATLAAHLSRTGD